MAWACYGRTQYISQGEAAQLKNRMAQAQGDAKILGMAASANAVREDRVWANLAFPPPGYRALPGAALMAQSPRWRRCRGLTERCQMVL